MSGVPELDDPEQLTGNTRATVLVLHGGAEKGTTPVSWNALAVLRMTPFAWAIRQAVPEDVAVVRLKFRQRGWNGRAADPVKDTQVALEQIAKATGNAPVILVGHSMGGRAALNVLDHRQVIAMVGLAPWVVRADSVQARPGQRLYFRHAKADKITSAKATARLARRLAQQGVDVELDLVRFETHGMLARPWEWHSRTARFVAQVLSDVPARA